MNIAGKNVPTPVVVGGVVLVGAIGYYWYKNRSSSASGAAASTGQGDPASQGGGGYDGGVGGYAGGGYGTTATQNGFDFATSPTAINLENQAKAAITEENYLRTLIAALQAQVNKIPVGKGAVKVPAKPAVKAATVKPAIKAASKPEVKADTSKAVPMITTASKPAAAKVMPGVRSHGPATTLKKP